MKNIGIIAAVAVTAVTVTGCISTNTSDSGNMTLNPRVTGPLDEYRPTYKVDEKNTVAGKSKLHWCLGFIWGANGFADFADAASEDEGILSKFLPSVKGMAAKAAYYNACEENKCDAIVAGRYTIKKKDYFVYAQYDTTFYGYPATQTGIETIKATPYYIDANGKVVVLDKFVKMHNVMKCDKASSADKGVAGGLTSLIPLPF